MLVRSQERRPLLGFSALLTQSIPQQTQVASTVPPRSPKESIFILHSLTSPPPWATQALSNLEQGERELQSLRERQQAEVDEVNRELDNAAINAQREERRLLEKVERDHKEAQRRLSQVKRENAATIRVVQSLIDQQLQKMWHLKEQIQRWGSTAGGANQNQLQRGVAEVTQPWEISLTIKRVSFLPHESKTLCLGEVDVYEQGITYPIGVCGVQGQKCALHSGDSPFSNITPVEIHKEPSTVKAEQRQSPEESTKTTCGNLQIFQKQNLLSSTANEELRSSMAPTPKYRGISESSQEEQANSMCSDIHGQDLLTTIPAVSSQGESEGDESDGKWHATKRRYTVKGKKKKKNFVLVSCEETSFPLESDSLSRYSLGHLSTRANSFSQNESSKDSGSPPSPAASEDSFYVYPEIIPVNESFKQEQRLSLSPDDFSGKLSPVNHGDKGVSGAIRRVNRIRLAAEPSTLEQGHGHGSESEPNSNTTDAEKPCSRPHTSIRKMFGLNPVNRSLSIPDIKREESQQYKNDNKQNDVAALRELEEERGSTALDSAYLVKQFGKQGSGRTDFNLPSGIHATVKGQLFVVDCGNARIQVTDLQKNVVQQVSPSGPERSSRICNYFDVAVNSKGLIALTCAAERAVLVFNRHGRLLQTFGGTMNGSTSEELDAPRGVTVTRQDDFLVADIKRGSLTSMKLDPKTGTRLERTVITGYHRPYLVAACLTTGLMVLSERGNETGRVPCIRVLDPGWSTIRILGVCSGLGPVLSCPWGLCIDSSGDVLVTDWGKHHHRVLLYPSKGVGWPLVTDNLNSPRGLALLPHGHMAVSDSMNHSVKIYRYK
ncbi:uncharacterized protein LOC133483991 [Phyllopteryx taeniolatus]|uniref:uncharacterized protein LOC133483991 n=1 Tax=Phyllopteryx taeniolatus TaxID=161469 RepID=UPI002AD32D02|nr:uncharacterized protein LOC133483991 [Phyllopteryx taeniolatus]XP_061641984.1 uncharacterized protein LOC133483991 [Phyllopteryx taeniolatus]